MSDHPIFSVTNHHASSCGAPPPIDDTTPNRYRGYFENEHGEQAIFVCDRATGEATLYLGDAGWERSHRVVDGRVTGLNLNATEQAWLATCWRASHRT
jgi:hypothetical protein